MFEIILISHGPLSKAMLETAQMIVGEQEHVTCFGLYLGDSVDLFRERVEEEIRNKLEESDALVRQSCFGFVSFVLNNRS